MLDFDGGFLIAVGLFGVVSPPHGRVDFCTRVPTRGVDFCIKVENFSKGSWAFNMEMPSFALIIVQWGCRLLRGVVGFLQCCIQATIDYGKLVFILMLSLETWPRRVPKGKGALTYSCSDHDRCQTAFATTNLTFH